MRESRERRNDANRKREVEIIRVKSFFFLYLCGVGRGGYSQRKMYLTRNSPRLAWVRSCTRKKTLKIHVDRGESGQV